MLSFVPILIYQTSLTCRSGNIIPSNSSSAVVVGIESLRSGAGKNAGSNNYHASYLEGVLGSHAGVGMNLPASVLPQQLRYGRAVENKDRDIGPGLSSTGHLSQHFPVPHGDAYPPTRSSMSPTAGVNTNSDDCIKIIS